MVAATGGRLPVARARDGIVPAVLAGCDGAVRGLLLSIAIGFGAGVVGTLALLGWSLLDGGAPARSGSETDPLLALVIGVPIAAVAAGRAADALAWHGEVAMAVASRTVALAGALVLVLVFLFVVRVTLLPAMLLAEAAIVLAWVIGALLGGRAQAERLTVPRWIVLSVLLGLGFFGVWAMAGTRPSNDAGADPPPRDLALVGERLADGTHSPVGLEMERGSGTLTVTPVAGEGDGHRWSDLRLELWAALPRASSWPWPDDRVGDPDPALAGPIRVVPLPGGPSDASVTIRYDDVRGLREGLLILTGIADGRRFALIDVAVVAEYRATPWAWFLSLAADAPDAVHPVAP